MDKQNSSNAKGFAILVAILLAVPIIAISVVGVRTWLPLREARQSLDELELALGPEAHYTPATSGEIPAERMERFLEVRATLVGACQAYGTVQEAFEAVAALDSSGAGPEEIPRVTRLLGSAAFSITPFLASFFELRNRTLLEATMGLEEYAYIYALAYHERLLSERTRAEIFSGGDALSAEASVMLRGCLARQVDAIRLSQTEASLHRVVEAELTTMDADPARLIWQDGLPAAISASLAPYRDRLDRVFCGATAGLEMERSARRALRLALE